MVPENLYLLAGHPDFGDKNVGQYCFGESRQPTRSLTVSQNMPAYIRLRATGESYKFDYIIVDLSPSANAINKLFVMSAGFLIVPTSPDYFSPMAVRSLAEKLPAWDDWFNA